MGAVDDDFLGEELFDLHDDLAERACGVAGRRINRRGDAITGEKDGLADAKLEARRKDFRGLVSSRKTARELAQEAPDDQA